jgi:hypothetical protein
MSSEEEGEENQLKTGAEHHDSDSENSDDSDDIENNDRF